MKKSDLKNIIQEEIKSILSEEYQDKFQFSGKMVTNTKERSQTEILSDIRSLPGVTIVSTEELEDTTSSDKFVTILNLKLDGYPFIKKGGFSRETIGEIADLIRKVPNVDSFSYNPENIKTL